MRQASQKVLEFRHKKVKSTYRVIGLNYEAKKVVWKRPTASREIKNKQKTAVLTRGKSQL